MRLEYRYPIEKMCKIFNVSKSGYYVWSKRRPTPRQAETARLELCNLENRTESYTMYYKMKSAQFKHSKLAVKKWSLDKHPIIALLSPQIAAFSLEIPDILEFQKKHQLFSHTYSVPDLPSWYALYNSTWKYLKPFLEMISKISPLGQNLIVLIEVLLNGITNSPQSENDNVSSEQTERAKTFINDLLNMSFEDLRDDWSDASSTPEIDLAVQQYKDTYGMELDFIFMIAMPCWLFYKQLPATLYNKATEGDIDAIHQLLRLDPSTLHDPAIGKQIQIVRFDCKRESEYPKLLKAPLQPIKLKLTNRTIKDMLAGFISVLAESLEHPLTSTEIRDLFDAVSRDSHKQDIDTSLPDSQEAYSKAIQRNRTDWKNLLQTGQKKVT